MSKRVLIQYSVELTEVPERISIMLTEVANSFGAASKELREAASKAAEDPYECVRDMQKAKKEFAKKQVRMEELTEILISYIVEMKVAAEQVNAEPEPEEQEAALQEEPPAKKKKKKKKKKVAKKKAKKDEE